jgi:hypothetical protein
MTTKTQYFLMPGQFTLDSMFLIKFDGRYSYWGSRSGKWICDPTLLKQSWIDEYFTPITAREARKIIEGGASLPDYRKKKNPRITLDS